MLAVGGIAYRLRHRLDGWALIVAARDVEAARASLDAFVMVLSEFDGHAEPLRIPERRTWRDGERGPLGLVDPVVGHPVSPGERCRYNPLILLTTH